MERTAIVLADGIHFGESPRWRDGRLWFSDFFAQAVKSVSSAGDLRTEFTIEDLPSGLGWTPDGDMLIVAMQSRRLLRRSKSGVVSNYADLSEVTAFLANDMVVDGAGGAYVGSFGFDLESELLSRGPESVVADHPVTKLARISPTGMVSVVAEDMHFPNGSVITPGGRQLIVAETLAGRLTAFDIGSDGRLADRRVFAQTWPRAPDGIALDASGAVWAANALGPECVRYAQGGEVLDVVKTSQNCYACMLGGDDGKTLFMLTAPTSISTAVAGKGLGRIETVQVDSPHAGRP